MNRLFYLLLFTGLSMAAWSQDLQLKDDESKVRFKIKNLGFNVTGSFSGLQGAIQFDPNNLAACNFNVSIDANTINTGISGRDNHLRKESYFDVKNHPRIQFVSTKVTPSTRKGTLFIFGKLTIKGTTKDISFPFIATPVNGGYLFKGDFKINRRDFDVGGGSTISDNLTVMLEVTAKKG